MSNATAHPMIHATAVAVFVNEATGLAGVVTPSERFGFAVSLLDTDAGEYVGLVEFRRTQELAESLAAQIVEG